MAKKKSIHQVISEVLRQENSPLSAEDIYSRILEQGLYIFPAKDALGVVRNTLRRHCVDLDFATARKKKYFSRDSTLRYSLLPKPVVSQPTVVAVKSKKGDAKNRETVSIPYDAHDETVEPAEPRHSEIQWRLVDLGLRIGMNVWVPRNDRTRSWAGGSIKDFSNLAERLPPQFEPAAMKMVEYIDVIWLDRESIFAAFEVEHTTPIYSGLLRMADLMTLVPNQDVNWYIVSSEARFDKFSREVNRPVFKKALRKPLFKVCRFLSYERLLERLEKASDVIDDLKPTFIERISEFYTPDEEDESNNRS